MTIPNNVIRLTAAAGVTLMLFFLPGFSSAAPSPLPHDGDHEQIERATSQIGEDPRNAGLYLSKEARLAFRCTPH